MNDIISISLFLVKSMVRLATLKKSGLFLSTLSQSWRM
jgi:hypothetical protein